MRAAFLAPKILEQVSLLGFEDNGRKPAILILKKLVEGCVLVYERKARVLSSCFKSKRFNAPHSRLKETEEG
jgi:hypothetical protein